MKRHMNCLVMYCKNKHEVEVCFRDDEFYLRAMAVALVNALTCYECGAVFDEWRVEEHRE